MKQKKIEFNETSSYSKNNVLFLYEKYKKENLKMENLYGYLLNLLNLVYLVNSMDHYFLLF